MTETNFTIQWLKDRFPYDSVARNKRVEQSCLDYYRDRKNISLLDIGSGTGASCIYFMEKWSASQIWTLVELNPALAAASIERIEDYAAQNGYVTQRGAQQLFLQKEQKFVTVNVLQKSFLELDDFIDWGSIDLVTATAVFDLLSKEMFADFIQPLIAHKIPLLATINYERMIITPDDYKSDLFSELYTAHMKRPQTFGVSMGGDSAYEMYQVFRNNGLSYKAGQSHWFIHQEDELMITYLLDYMTNAIPDLLDTDEEKAALTDWITQKKKEKNISIEVCHWDLFMYF